MDVLQIGALVRLRESLVQGFSAFRSNLQSKYTKAKNNKQWRLNLCKSPMFQAMVNKTESLAERGCKGDPKMETLKFQLEDHFHR